MQPANGTQLGGACQRGRRHASVFTLQSELTRGCRRRGSLADVRHWSFHWATRSHASPVAVWRCARWRVCARRSAWCMHTLLLHACRLLCGPATPTPQINLFLRVVRRREDGFHDLASLFHVRLRRKTQLATLCPCPACGARCAAGRSGDALVQLAGHQAPSQSLLATAPTPPHAPMPGD